MFRAGIEAVHPSQRLAARSLGLSYSQSMRRVILPQAVRKVTPALMNDFVALQKDVGLISVLGAVDAVRAAQIETAAYFNFTPYVVAGLLFFLLALPMIRFTDWYTARVRAPRADGEHRMSRRPGSTASVTVDAAPVLRLVGIRKSFEGTEVLRGIDLTVHRHEIVALIGASGSGKSTLLRTANLLEQIDDGQIFLGDDDISDPRTKADARPRPHRRRVPALQPVPAPQRARQRHPGEPRGAPSRRGPMPRSAASSCSTTSASPTRPASFPDRLSGGQQQRAAIVRAIATDPELLLLDEITSALDPELVGEVLDLVRELGRGGTTILMATHEMAFARDVAAPGRVPRQGRRRRGRPACAAVRALRESAHPRVPGALHRVGRPLGPAGSVPAERVGRHRPAALARQR